jgi:hypothetical protein
MVDQWGTCRELGTRYLALEMSTQSHEATLASLEAFANRVRPPLGG